MGSGFIIPEYPGPNNSFNGSVPVARTTLECPYNAGVLCFSWAGGEYFAQLLFVIYRPLYTAQLYTAQFGAAFPRRSHR